MLSISKRGIFVSLVIQKGFWGDTVLADTRRKLAQLYLEKPEIARSDKSCILEFWSNFEGLSSLLGNKWPSFIDWFKNSTSPETITRCLRALKEDGTIRLSPDHKKNRQDSEKQWRTYWGSEKGLTNDLFGGDNGG